MSDGDRIGLTRSREGKIIRETGLPNREFKGSDILQGHDLTRILVIQETSRLIDAKGYVLDIAPICIFPSRSVTRVVTFRTGATFIANQPAALIRRSNVQPEVGDINTLNGIPLSVGEVDQVSFVVPAGEQWWAVFPAQGVHPVITVLEKALTITG